MRSIVSAIANSDDFFKKQNCMPGRFYPMRVVGGLKATKQMLHKFFHFGKTAEYREANP